MLKFGNSTDEESKPATIEAVANHVYFYSDVTTGQCVQLLKTLHEVEQDLMHDGVSRRNAPPDIYLHIHSEGGDALAAFAVADQLNAFAIPIHSIIEGLAASAATIISLACQKRYITPHSFLLIHSLSGELWGNFEQMKDDFGMYEMVMENIVQFYTVRTTAGEDKIREMLKRNSWFNAQMALELGLVDDVRENYERF